MAAGNSYCLGIKSNDFFLKDNKKAFILWLNVPKVTAYSGFTKSHPAYSKEEAMRLSDKWEEQISLILRFLDWKKQIKK